MNTQKQIVLIVALFFLFVGGCAAYTAIDLPIRAEDQADWTRDQSLERGALLYANNCRTCHGNRGEGSVGPQLLANPQTNFQDQDPLILKANRDLLRRTLQCGRAGTLMPAWLNTNGGALNAIQIEHIVNFLSSPVEETEDGTITSHWWDEAEHFAHNLNAEVAVLVGGDTLETIAEAHGIGPKELAAANNLPVEGTLKQGTELRIPGFKADPDGYTYTVYKDNETIEKVAKSQFVGAVVLADLNGLPYKFTSKRGVATFTLRTPDGKSLAGLFPGQKLRLPEGSIYVISAGDTIDGIASRHGIPASDIVSRNRDLLGSLANDAEIPFERRLKLPKSTVIVQAGQTLAAIAELHDIQPAALASENGLAADAAPEAGTALKLPLNAQYVVQAGDTWEQVARAHATDAAALAQANGSSPNDPLSPDVPIQLPKIDGYVVQGQNLEEVAAGYANVTADSLAEANEIKADTVLAINTQLKLPETAYGTAPSTDSRNPGTACVQWAVTRSAFDVISGNVQEVEKPTTVTNELKVEAHANDWTFIADGTAQAPNKGVALIKTGSTVTFTSVAGLHNITLNGETEKPDLKQGDTRQITFNTAGKFDVTCTYHPDMFGTLFVE